MKIGSLCSGYEGLGLGVQAVLGGHTVWVSDVDKGANKILAHRYPDVPNLGDMTTVDWAAVEPVDVLTAGYPCQPFSHAGRRKGTNDERHLWPYVREAVRVLRPRLTLLENVAGHRSLGFDRVLGDLAEDGMHVRWTSVRASDVGAPHQRERLFIAVGDADESGLEGRWAGERPDQRPAGASGVGPGPELLPTPRSTRGGSNTETVALLPTPLNSDAGPRGGTTGFGLRDWSRAHAKGEHGNGHGKSLAIEAQRLLPTPSAMAPDAKVSDRARELYSSSDRLGDIVEQARWGDYAAAIARWEHVLGRPAPAPTVASTKGNPQLSPRFVEWMQGLPAGWVTDVPGITRNEALKALGNGVVPQQAAAALRVMAAWDAWQVTRP